MVSSPIMSFFLLIGLVASLVLAVDLGIKKDASLEPYKLHAYGSVCDFKNEPSNDQFISMIEQAYKDMAKMLEKVESPYQKPSAMIGLGIGNQVYFASSVRSGTQKPIIYKTKFTGGKKGGHGEMNELPEMPAQFKKVTDALEACSNDGNSDPQHKSNGMCGELTSTMAWMIDNPEKDISEESPRVAAWDINGYLPPCTGTPEKPNVWGCSKWTKEMKYEVIKDDNPNRDPEDIPDPTSTKNVAMEKCAKVKIEDEGEKGKGGKGKGKREVELNEEYS